MSATAPQTNVLGVWRVRGAVDRGVRGDHDVERGGTGARSALARGFCAYVAVFWGVRVALQGVFDVKDYLITWWLKTGYAALTLMFAGFAAVYGFAAVAGGR